MLMYAVNGTDLVGRLGDPFSAVSGDRGSGRERIMLSRERQPHLRPHI